MPKSKHLTLSDVISYPLPGYNIPAAIRFSPGKNAISFLHSEAGNLSRLPYEFDLETGETNQLITLPDEGIRDDNISIEETLRRERLRQREFGITQYVWSAKENRLLIPLRGSIYVQDGREGKLRQLVDGQNAPCQTPRFSPDGKWIAYVQNAEIYVVSAQEGSSHQVTTGARGTGKTHGLAEFIAQEEMDRKNGFWWSPDSEKLAFTEVDETHIPVYRIMHQGKDRVGAGAQEDHRYPFAGAANARVRLGVINRDGRGLTWLELGAGKEYDVARVNWLPDGRLTAQVLNREQSQLDLLVFDLQTGASTCLLRETSDVWINLHHLFRPLPDGRFIWASERTGFRHLYLYAKDGTLLRQLTSGDWLVDTIAGIDDKKEMIYLTGTLATPLECHLYAVSFQGDEPRLLTPEPGMHTVVLDKSKQRFLDNSHSNLAPPTITLRSLSDGTHLQEIYGRLDPRLHEKPLDPPEIVTVPNRAGDELMAAIYQPPAAFGSGPFPTIVSVYGGPHAQRVANSWLLTVDLRAQYLAQQGFLVFKLDNRGSARRGLAFEASIKHHLGCCEVDDQVDGVRWLVKKGLADPERVGIYGWSYGGYLSLMCLAQAGETFKTAVAGAPVTDFDGYDTCYTERYMGTPQSNPDGYRLSSVMAHAGRIQGNLLLIHGLIDENVHFRHTARLLNVLNREQRVYELLIFPDERHMPRQPADRLYLEERLTQYFRDNL